MRAYGPLTADHPAVGEICPLCERPLVAGDVPTLIPLGPGNDIEQRMRAAEGRPYNAVCAVAHWACIPDQARTANRP